MYKQPKNKFNYEKSMSRVIREIRDGEDILIGKDPWAGEYLETCMICGYVTGYSLARNGNGDVIGQKVNPRVTLKGFDFLVRSRNRLIEKYLPLAFSGFAVLASLASIAVSIFL